MPARAQAEFYEALLDANRALLGGNSDVDGKQWQQPTNLPFFFQPMSPLGDQRRSFLRDIDADSEEWNSQSITLE